MNTPKAQGESQAGDYRIFDRALLRRRRARAARGFGHYGFLIDHVAEGMVERLSEVNRHFDRVLDLGCHSGGLADRLSHISDSAVVRADIAPEFLATQSGPRVAADEEALPFADESFDLIASCLSLHWANDLPGVLVQARRALKADGLFVAALLGGQTLTELRQCLGQAEAEVTGGMSPRVAPFADVRDGGDLLARAGFAMPVSDAEVVTITYDNALALMHDLRGMGEANLMRERRKTPPPRALFPRAAQLYAEKFAMPDGRIAATFEVVYLTGWRKGQESRATPE